jgi:hypothetical protein
LLDDHGPAVPSAVFGFAPGLQDGFDPLAGPAYLGELDCGHGHGPMPDIAERPIPLLPRLSFGHVT